MQIVQALAGYSLGRADLVRRAMSKKKASVMEKERQNFVYGNEAEGVPGCIKNGIDEKTANKIYDEMIDFAKYAFNKRSSLEFYYRFDYKISDEPVFDDFPTVDYISSERESHHIIGLEYGYKF